MATQNKPVLGYRYCPECEERGTVHQSAGKRAGFLYQRCGCGADQRNGAWIQTRLWYETNFLPLEDLPEGTEHAVRPGNVKDAGAYLKRYGRESEIGYISALAELQELGIDPAPYLADEYPLRNVHEPEPDNSQGEGGEGAADVEELEAVQDDVAASSEAEPEPEAKGAGKLWLAGAGLVLGALALVAKGG